MEFKKENNKVENLDGFFINGAYYPKELVNTIRKRAIEELMADNNTLLLDVDSFKFNYLLKQRAKEVWNLEV